MSAGDTPCVWPYYGLYQWRQCLWRPCERFMKGDLEAVQEPSRNRQRSLTVECLVPRLSLRRARKGIVVSIVPRCIYCFCWFKVFDVLNKCRRINSSRKLIPPGHVKPVGYNPAHVLIARGEFPGAPEFTLHPFRVLQCPARRYVVEESTLFLTAQWLVSGRFLQDGNHMGRIA